MVHFMKVSPHNEIALKNDAGCDMSVYLSSTRMMEEGTWTTDVELVASAILLQTTIYVFTGNGNRKRLPLGRFRTSLTIASFSNAC